MKKIIAVLISIILLTVTVAAQVPESARKIVAGDYIVFGKYNDADILWRCIGNDENGMLFFADRILTLKSFDSPHLDENGQGDKYGLNSWAKSNIRAWLNSDMKEGQVVWGCEYPPKKDNTYDENNYENEKGFLADGNFTNTERSIIKFVSQKDILNNSEITLADGGSEIHYNKSVLGVGENTETQTTAKSNFDKAYFQWVTDKVFLLDVEQIGRGNVVLSANPTRQAVEQSTYKNPNELNKDKPWQYCLKTPIATATTNVRRVDTRKGNKNPVSNNQAADSAYGIRPAFYLDTDYAFIFSGNGDVNNPYVIDGIEAKILLENGNSPMAMIENDTSITDKEQFKVDYQYNGTYYNPSAWTDINYDMDKKALFTRKGTYFRDPGFIAYDTKGQPLSNMKRRITVSVYKDGDIKNVEDKTFELLGNVRNDYLFFQLRLWNIVPGIYSIEYSTIYDSNKVMSASRPLIVLSQVGDINYDGVTNSIDANYLTYLLNDEEQLDLLPEENLAERLYKYRIWDVNNDNVINKKDIDLIYMNMRGAILTYYKI